MWQDYGALGFQPLCIDLWENMNVVKTYARMYSQQFLRDPGTVWPNYTIGNYTPLNYVIDTAGIVVYEAVGFNETVIRAEIEANLPPPGINEGARGPTLRITSIEPNPTSQAVVVRFSAVKSTDVTMRIYSNLGTLIRSLRTNAHAGNVVWNLCDESGHRVANGLYICRLNNNALATISVLR